MQAHKHPAAPRPKPGVVDIKDAFKEAMRDAGMTPPAEVIADGRLHRFHIEGHKRGSLNGAYKLHLDGHRPAGYFEDFVAGIKANWKLGGDTTPPTPEEQKRMAEATERRKQDDAKRYEAAAETARRLWESAEHVAGRGHPYLERKRVDAHGLRRLRAWYKRIQTQEGEWQNATVHGVLLVPMADTAGRLWNVQAIFAEPHPLLGRDKDFLRGGRLRGLSHAIGKPTPSVVVCEGYATGASIHAATALQVYCAFAAGNLLAVAQAIRAATPGAKIIIAADNDAHTPQNPGLAAAKKAAAAVGGLLAVPPIPGDFNDLQNLEAINGT